MPFFGRREHAPETTNGTNGVTHDKHHGHGHHVPFPNRFVNRRPPFGQWLKSVWLDILTMAALGAVGLGVYEAPPAPSRSFPVYYQDGEVVFPEFAYPMRKNIIPIYAAALLASLIPIFIILLMQIRVRSFWDANNAILGLLYSLINAAVFQVFIKWLIGGLRPHFYAACKPNVPASDITMSSGLQAIMYDRSVCTGDEDEINDSLESMPSGHSTAAFAGFVFLFLYLNGKLKVWSNYHPAMWKITAVYAPILGATLIAGSLTIDKFHHWYDVCAGALIGTIFAFSSYRSVYASCWDFRFNHIPLTRGHDSLGFGYGMPGEGVDDGWWSVVATRKAGWGWEGAGLAGAPFDAHPAGITGAVTGGHSSHMGGARTGHHRTNGDMV